MGNTANTRPAVSTPVSMTEEPLLNGARRRYWDNRVGAVIATAVDVAQAWQLNSTRWGKF